MRTVLIADDEPLIVTGLSEKVDWESVGCRVVGMAYNGDDAIKMLDQLDPDILLTDIVMPGKSGLELAAYLRENGRRTRVVLLSTYDHFDYAREGIRMGVIDYILKPIDIKKLMEAVEKAVQNLCAMEETRMPQAGGSEISRKEALFEIIQHGIAYSSEEALRRSHFERGILFVAKVFNSSEQEAVTRKKALKHALLDAMENIGVKAYARTIAEMIAMIILTGHEREENAAAQKVDALCRSLCEAGVMCTAVRSKLINKPEQLHEAYEAALYQLRQTYFAANGGLIDCAGKSQTVIIQTELDNIRTALNHGNAHQVEHEMEALKDRLISGHDPDQAAHAFREVVRLATVCASSIGMVEKPQMRSIRVEENFDCRYETVLRYTREICSFIEKSQSISGRLQLLMQDNFTRSDFSLSDLADRMGMSVPYLSRLFKIEMGENFQDLLVAMRIEKAKKLLRSTSLKNNEIARRVGFEDERYFGQVFRKRCAMTPKQYREMI